MDDKAKEKWTRYWAILADIKMDAVVQQVESYLGRVVEKGMGAKTQ